jgi:hypothetical protein
MSAQHSVEPGSCAASHCLLPAVGSVRTGTGVCRSDQQPTQQQARDDQASVRGACRNRSGYSRLEHGFTHTARIRYWSKDCEDCSKEHSHSVSPYGPSDEIPGRPVHVTEIEQGAGSPVYTFSVDENCCDKLRVRRPFRQRRSQRQSDTGCLATATAQDLPAVARHRVSWKEKRCMKNEHMSLGAAFVGQTHPESFNMTII